MKKPKYRVIFNKYNHNWEADTTRNVGWVFSMFNKFGDIAASGATRSRLL